MEREELTGAVKGSEREHGDPAIVLNSFVVANTPYRNLKPWARLVV